MQADGETRKAAENQPVEETPGLHHWAEDEARALFEYALDAILIADDTATLIDANPLACSLLGLQRERLSEWKIFDLFMVEDRSLADALWQDFLKQGEQEGIVPLRHADGSILVGEYRARAHYVPGKHLTVIRDITNPETTETALRESKERLRLALNAAEMGTFIWHVQEDRGEPDTQMLALFGQPPDGTLTLKEVLATMIHPDDAPHYAEAVARSIDPQGTGELREDVRVRMPDGTLRWLAISGQVFFAGEPRRATHMAGAAIDITNRKKAEDTLRASEEHHALLLKLNDRLRPLADPVDIQYEAARVLGEYLKASRVGYAEDLGDDETVVVQRHYINGVPDIQGQYYHKNQGPALLRELLLAHTVAHTDIPSDPTLTDAEKAAYATLQVRADVSVPLVKGGRLIALLFVHYQEPRETSAEELALLEAVAERTWAAVEQERAEQALREREARLSAIFSRAAVGLSEIDMDGRFLRVNDELCRILGRSRETLLTLSIPDVTRPDDIAPSLDVLKHALEGDRFASLDKRYRQPDGTLVWANSSVTVLRDEQGKPRTCLIVTTELTARKQAEAALRASEEKYRTLFNSMDEGFCIIEVLFGTNDTAYDYHFLEVNPAFEKQTGLSNALSKTMRELAPDHEAYWFEIYGNIALTGIPARFEDYARVLGRHYDVYAFRVGEPEERRVAILFSDITERKRQEGALQEALQAVAQAKDALEQRVQERTTALADALFSLEAGLQERQMLMRRLVNTQEEERRRLSRELHDHTGQHLTALSLSIQTFDEALRRATQETGTQATENMKAALLPLLERLRTMATGLGQDLHRVAVELRPTSLDDLGLLPALRAYGEEWSQRVGIEVTLESLGMEALPGGRLARETETAIYRVVQEALTNVARYAIGYGSGGEGATSVAVTLQVRPAQKAAHPALIQVTVEDDGPGFDLEEARTKGRLGLAGMRERAELLGGSLEVETAPGEGTTIYLRLPLETLKEDTDISMA
jgi:PAS domain S-box-containing protein